MSIHNLIGHAYVILTFVSADTDVSRDDRKEINVYRSYTGFRESLKCFNVVQSLTVKVT